MPGVNDQAMLTATGADCGLPTISAVRLVLEAKPGLPTDPNNVWAFSLESLGEESRGGMRMRPSKLIMCALMSVFVGTGLVGFFAPSVMADDTLASFKGGIAVIPVTSGVGTAATAEVVNRNIVRGVQPAVAIWVIRNLEAKVTTNGDIKVEGEGLLFASSAPALSLDDIGGTGGDFVFATLICEAAAPFTEHNSNLNGVPLDPNGNFRIDDVLSDAPTTCDSPVLLIRNAANSNWFAAGIPAQD
jgi:hypothetical protein